MSLEEQIRKLKAEDDLDGLDKLVQSLDPEDIKKHKTELADAYMMVYSVWYYDLMCDKLSPDNPAKAIDWLLEILDSAEKVDPENLQYADRADCYEYMENLKQEPAEKLHYIQLAIDLYTRGVQNTTEVELNTNLADAMLTRMAITQVYADSEFTTILNLFQVAFAAYKERTHVLFLHACFKILGFPFDKNHEWHNRFMDQLDASLAQFAKTDAYLHLAWSNELVRLLEHKIYDISPEHHAALIRKSVELLEPLADYQTNHAERLNSLGLAFKNAALNIPDGKLRYYQIALNYYVQGHTVNPAAWTFTVYATNVQVSMAMLSSQEQIIMLFEAGKTLFATTSTYDNGFTLMLNWGHFLIEYARVAYNFQSPGILKEAEEKLLLAKGLGEGYYSQPFAALAKIAWKQGDKEKCFDILQECKDMFAAQQFNYDFSSVLNDEDFREIWPEVTSKLLS
jgi:hypothetical protein